MHYKAHAIANKTEARFPEYLHDDNQIAIPGVTAQSVEKTAGKSHDILLRGRRTHQHARREKMEQISLVFNCSTKMLIFTNAGRKVVHFGVTSLTPRGSAVYHCKDIPLVKIFPHMLYAGCGVKQKLVGNCCV